MDNESRYLFVETIIKDSFVLSIFRDVPTNNKKQCYPFGQGALVV